MPRCHPFLVEPGPTSRPINPSPALGPQGRPASVLDVEVPEGNGSGVIWDEGGNCVTNYHVLASSMAKLGVDKDPGARGGAAGPGGWGLGAGLGGRPGVGRPAEAGSLPARRARGGFVSQQAGTMPLRRLHDWGRCCHLVALPGMQLLAQSPWHLANRRLLAKNRPARAPPLDLFDPAPRRAAAGRGKRVAVVTVLSRDGEKRVYDATLVGADKARDLAVLQVGRRAGWAGALGGPAPGVVAAASSDERRPATAVGAAAA